MSISADFPGWSNDPSLVSVVTSGRPLSRQWITDDLLADTRRVWSQEYGRIITEEEAVEILTNVKRLAEVLWKPEQKGQAS